MNGNKKPQSRLSFLLVGLAALAVAFVAGMVVGRGRADVAASGPTDVLQVDADKFAPFWKAWQVLDEKSVSAASTTMDQKVWGSIEGLASSYGDPYTVFFPPVENKMFQEDIAGDFEGVGMEIGIKDKQLQVVAPIKGSPAASAGVKTGDFILAIDGKDTAGMPVDQAVKLIRGQKNTVVKITFLPKGASKPVVRSITRGVINIPTIETDTKPGGIFVIRLYSFTAQSADLFRGALREFVVSGDHKLILDLRGNPGGYLEAAWDMASWFLPSSDKVVTEDFGTHGDPKVYRSKGYNIFNKNLDMLILVDNGSASAAEILSGALSENGVAKLVGSKTFGKGSVQELVQITPETSLKVTVARWLTPDGHNLSENGLDPDYPVAAAPTATSTDPVMDKAIGILEGEK